MPSPLTHSTSGSSRILIAVDGTAASGKGLLARRLAERFNLAHLDTGVIYRALGAQVRTLHVASLSRQATG